MWQNSWNDSITFEIRKFMIIPRKKRQLFHSFHRVPNSKNFVFVLKTNFCYISNSKILHPTVSHLCLLFFRTHYRAIVSIMGEKKSKVSSVGSNFQFQEVLFFSPFVKSVKHRQTPFILECGA